MNQTPTRIKSLQITIRITKGGLDKSSPYKKMNHLFGLDESSPYNKPGPFK